MMQALKRRKKKQSLSWSHTEVEILMTETEIAKRCKRIFKSHVGVANAISPFQLFEKVYGVSPQKLGRFKAEYWYLQLKKVLRYLRMTNELYTTFRGRKVFVLQSKEELAFTQHVIDRHIGALKVSRSNAEKWVKDELWKKYLDSEGN